MKKKAIVALFILCIGFSVLESETRAESASPQVSAKSFIIIDAVSGRTLCGENFEDKRAMASTTKIMTSIIALEKGNLKSQVKVSPRAASVGGSSFNLSIGERLSLENMLYGLLLPSGNDAAIAIAEHIGSTEENFVHMMNEKAVELGALNTHFANPHGLDNPQHYSTAKDLALITRHALKNEKFREIIGTRTKKIDGGNYNKQVTNTNRLLWESENVHGVKTGYTGNAGKCLVAFANENGLQILSVVLGAHDHFCDSRILLNYALTYYKLTPIIRKNTYCTTVPVQNSFCSEVDLMTTDDVNLALNKDEKLIFELVLPKTIKAPVNKGENIGELQIFINNNLSFSAPLIAANDVQAKRYGVILLDILKFWIKIKI